MVIAFSDFGTSAAIRVLAIITRRLEVLSHQMRWAQKYWGKAARERYQRYLQSDAWKTKRKAVLHAAGFRCRRCGVPATEVHHETYKRIYNERLSDLTALCSDCHQAAHSGKKQKVNERYLILHFEDLSISAAESLYIHAFCRKEGDTHGKKQRR